MTIISTTNTAKVALAVTLGAGALGVVAVAHAAVTLRQANDQHAMRPVDPQAQPLLAVVEAEAVVRSVPSTMESVAPTSDPGPVADPRQDAEDGAEPAVARPDGEAEADPATPEEDAARRGSDPVTPGPEVEADPVTPAWDPRIEPGSDQPDSSGSDGEPRDERPVDEDAGDVLPGWDPSVEPGGGPGGDGPPPEQTAGTTETPAADDLWGTGTIDEDAETAPPGDDESGPEGAGDDGLDQTWDTRHEPRAGSTGGDGGSDDLEVDDDSPVEGIGSRTTAVTSDGPIGLRIRPSKG